MAQDYPRDTYVVYPDAGVEVMNALFRKIYRWMAGGLILSAVTAHLVASSPAVLSMLYGRSFLMMALVLVELGLVVALSAGISRLSASTASFLFVLYSLLNGVTLSGILIVYTGQSVFNAFLTTAGMFGAMSVYGLYTKRDLTSLRSFLMMGLIGIVIASLVNLFLRSPVTDLVISAAGILIFLGLTAFDTQKIKAFAVSMGDVAEGEIAGKVSIMGALTLYLDFVNIFLFLLRFMGQRRE